MKLQSISQQFLRLSRDNSLWKELCFSHSVTERRRRRHETPVDAHTDPRLAELVRAADTISASFLGSVHDLAAPSADVQAARNEGKRRKALLANWDPSYPKEKVNWYEDFIQRHARHDISWFREVRHGSGQQQADVDEEVRVEATGAGILFDSDGMADKLVAPMEDGSLTIWDVSSHGHGRQGRIVARTAIGLLPKKNSDLDFNTRLAQSKTIMTETGAVESVSIDSRQKKGYFAVQNVLNEVDLRTLQVVSRTPYPFPITALSEARHPTPLTVGTNWTIHLHDTRKPPTPVSTSTMTTELIGGNPLHAISLSRLQTGAVGSHVSLSQPGALSILHMPSTREWDGNGDIWVAGRFTSFLNFDRRYFPRLRGTVHSGARLSCLTSVPHPYIPHSLRTNYPYTSPSLLREVKETSGHTIIAAGEYKGKGSLELYGLSSEPGRGINSSDTRTTRNSQACYQNRQTASSSKLLSVAPHGTRLVFADGDGNLKWVERDGSTPVRQLNINTDGEEPQPSAFSTTSAHEAGWGDIVQKILPTVSASQLASQSEEPPLGQDNLILWTGDGRLGKLSFGGSETFHDAVEDLDGMVEDEERIRERERQREYGVEMRKALEQQARELRWMRGYGLA